MSSKDEYLSENVECVSCGKPVHILYKKGRVVPDINRPVVLCPKCGRRDRESRRARK